MDKDKKKKIIFLVDDNITNLNIGKDILCDDYNVVTIPSAKKMFEMLGRILPDMILLDIEMPEMSGYDAIKLLKAREETADIPVIFLTVRGDNASELAGLSLGAVDYISKPFAPQLLAKRIEVHMTVETQKDKLKDYSENLLGMVYEKTKAVVDLQNAILRTIAEIVECRDCATGGHIERTQNYLRILVNAIVKNDLYRDEVAKWDIDFLVQSSQLHDVGKIGVSDVILNKPDKLTDEEFNEMKKHTTFGMEVVDKIQKGSSEEAFLAHAKIFAGTHHEKWDGTGYPKGLKGEEIPLEGRLMAIADVYDALISERPYKRAFSHESAVQIIINGSGTHFDPSLIEIFKENQDEFLKAARSVQQ